MEIEEIREKYNNMSLQEYGNNCKIQKLKVENQVYDAIGQQQEALVQASVFVLFEHYLAMGLRMRLYNFLTKFYVRGSRAGYAFDWWESYGGDIEGFRNEIGAELLSSGMDNFFREYGEKFFLETKRTYSPEKFQKKINKAKKSFANIGADEEILCFTSECVFGFSKGVIFTDKKIHFSTDKVFSVRYENIADIYIENSSGNNSCPFFKLHTIKGYAAKYPDCFSDEVWRVKILYYDEQSGELRDNELKGYYINKVEEAEYWWHFKDVILNEVFLRHYNDYRAALK